MSYAIVWSGNEGPDQVGKATVDEHRLRLSGGSSTGSRNEVDVPCAELSDVYIERSTPPKHPWEPVLVLVTRQGERFAIGSLEGLGALHELAERVERARPPIAC